MLSKVLKKIEQKVEGKSSATVASAAAPAVASGPVVASRFYLQGAQKEPDGVLVKVLLVVEVGSQGAVLSVKPTDAEKSFPLF